MHRHDDERPSNQTPDQQLRALARILAAGVLRLRARAALPPAATQPSGPQILAETGRNNLEVPVETRLSVHTG
jgi:hypothetical protein